MVARILITTADERTWPTNNSEPVLFLGEWCRRYSRKQVWEHLDAKVAPYHWDDRAKLKIDYNYLKELHEELLNELSEKLNIHHGINHTLRYWRILLGPWLGYFSQMLFDRWYMLRCAIEHHSISKAYVLERASNLVVPNDMASFSQLFVEDDWNEAIYAQLLRKCWGDQIEIIDVPHNTEELVKPVKSKGLKVQRKAVEYLLQQYNRITSKNDSYFFISTYLPLTTDLKLQAKLGQIPKIWRSQPVPKSAPRPEDRRWGLGNGDSDEDDFATIARSFIPNNIPTAYLEGFHSLLEIPNRLRWPILPKVIWTSNAYWSDDIFKAWAAEKAEEGAQLVIGQHGGHLGMNPFAFQEEHQIEIADQWLSWGWKDSKRLQIRPVGNLKVMCRKINHDPVGDALMVEMTMPRFSYHLYAAVTSRQWLDYFEEQQRFFEALPEKIRQRILLRLYPHDYGWDQIERWSGTGLDVRYDAGHTDIRTLIQKSRLYISTYNATTYLESLSWNVPTIIFWKPEHWELNEEAKPFFQLLVDAEILHFTPESAAQKMMQVWDDVESWWYSERVQKVKDEFCKQYAASVKDPVSHLTRLIKKISNDSVLSR